jgi:uncharacterized membrane protein YphA (DoxX/SURF4 family)
MNKRTLWGCIAAMGLLLVFAGLTYVFDANLNRSLMTPLGELPLFDLAGVLTATVAGGVVAGTRFRWFAVALMALLWVATLVVLADAHAGSWATALKYNALAILLTLAVAWAGAALGERWAARRHPVSQAG